MASGDPTTAVRERAAYQEPAEAVVTALDSNAGRGLTAEAHLRPGRQQRSSAARAEQAGAAQPPAFGRAFPAPQGDAGMTALFSPLLVSA